jgi:fucose permease
MLGVILPEISQKWGLRDDAAGFLFFLQFLGSSLGAILNGRNRIRSLNAGYGLLAVSTCALAFAGRDESFAVFFFFGLGLGMTMTATSLLISDRYGDDRAAVLECLNFAWSAGAACAPVLLASFLRIASLRLLFFTFLGLFLLPAVWVFFRERREGPFDSSIAGQSTPQTSAISGSLWPLAVLAMCAVGVESALSGWLTTYSHRADPEDARVAAVTTSLFWLGIMLSRLAFSTRLLRMIGRQRVVLAALCGVAASVALLISARTPSAIQVTSGLCGLSIGPLFPLLLSFLLERSPRGWIFAVAGMGSALLPWLTGILSAHNGSLRYGLIAPFGTALLMLVLFSVSFRTADLPDLITPSQR